MSLTLIIAFLLLISIAFFGRFFIQLPKNVWLLFFAQPLGMSSASMVVFAGGLVASKIAPRPELATLPLTLMILGTASAVIPASLLMQKFGRRKGTMFGLGFAVIGAMIAGVATIYSSFTGLIVAAVLLGFSMAFVAQMRFAVLESLQNPADSAKAISVLMVGGMFAAVIGPELAVNAKDWIDSPHGFAGSFFALAILLFLAILAISQLNPIAVHKQEIHLAARPIKHIVRQPIFIISVSAGAIGYSVMSYVMTAAPLSMHDVAGHSLEATKWVIQSHIIAMYLPSLFATFLIRWLGIAKLLIIGSLIYAGVIVIALAGQEVLHYWWAMVLLGVGWNFLFTSGTLLLPESYHTQERFKAQAVNDFSIFFVQAMGSLSAGLIIFTQGWNHLIMIVIPIVLLIFCISIWYFLLNKRRLSKVI